MTERLRGVDECAGEGTQCWGGSEGGFWSLTCGAASLSVACTTNHLASYQKADSDSLGPGGTQDSVFPTNSHQTWVPLVEDWTLSGKVLQSDHVYYLLYWQLHMGHLISFDLGFIIKWE